MKVVKRVINGQLVEYTIDGVSQLGLGDLLSNIFTPIARKLKFKCIDKETGQPKPRSSCDKRRQKLNKIKLYGIH